MASPRLLTIRILKRAMSQHAKARKRRHRTQKPTKPVFVKKIVGAAAGI
jgi:hypothetical protein